MSILVDASTKVLCQGFTGAQGSDEANRIAAELRQRLG